MVFEINQDCKITQKVIRDSIVYFIDDFYLNPYDVLKLFLSTPAELHKKDCRPSFNSIYFDDRRHSFISDEITPVYDYLIDICKQEPEHTKKTVSTNFTRFRKVSFNNYINNYWWPHIDPGYTAILYLNQDDCYSGTNLYKPLDIEKEPPANVNEHASPWRNKIYFELIETLEPKFNRMVLFDGFKFHHGMNICNDDYFDEKYRMNQVFFFKKNV